VEYFELIWNRCPPFVKLVHRARQEFSFSRKMQFLKVHIFTFEKIIKHEEIIEFKDENIQKNNFTLCEF
jgi:hypothetical protein